MENKYVKMVFKNLSHVVLGLLVVLLGAVYWLSQGGPELAPPAPPPLQTPDPLITEDYQKVQEVLAPKPPIGETRIDALKTFDLFEYRQVEDVEVRQQRATARFQEAKAAADAGNIDEALRILEDVYRIYPPHIQANELREQLQRQKEAAEAAAAAEAG